MKAARRIAAAAYPPYWYLDEHGTAKDPRRGADIGLTEAAIRAYQR
ncbi:hypothetical protein [Treponema endosymbiont of Eucomonympha sp.]|nr:hypothetical protein [Treponema endosymbiont of Eucomonympha sp.]